jgi:GMP synthase-like glutamine amidotransferase
MREHLEAVAAVPVSLVHYLDAGDLSSARAVVLSGSSAPWPEHDPNALEELGKRLVASERPVLGICAGLQLLAMAVGGEVRPMADRGGGAERGFSPLEVLDDTDLLRGLPARATVFQDHTDEIVTVPKGFEILARTGSCLVQAIADRERRWWGAQFHPERTTPEHPHGGQVLRNFFALAGFSAPTSCHAYTRCERLRGHPGLL